MTITAGHLIAVLLLLALVVAYLVWHLGVRNKATLNSGTVEVLASDPAFKAKELFYGPSESAPLITITPMKSGHFAKGADSVTVAPSRMKELNIVAQVLPEVLGVMQGHGERWMKVLVEGTLAPVGDGTFLPFVRGSHGEISTLARLKDAHGLTKLLNVATFWKIASMVVAKKQLADISSRLDNMNKGIDRINNFLLDQRRASISGPLTYLNEIAECIQGGDLPEITEIKMEDIEVQMVTVEHQIVAELHRWRERINQIDTFQLTSKSTFQQMQEEVGLLDGLFEEWLLCLQTRMINWRIFSCFGTAGSLIEARSLSEIDRRGADFRFCVEFPGPWRVSALSWVCEQEFPNRQSESGSAAAALAARLVA